MPLEECRFGLEKVSMNDYPGLVAAVVFIPGCNLRCPYCHNASLIRRPFPDDLLSFEKIINYLRKRKNVLGGVCISGGEPLLFSRLPELIATVRGLGFPVKIDTNGTLPDRLAQLSPDFIAMDIKTSPRKYDLLGCDYGEAVMKSVEWIRRSGIRHQFRTTVVPGITEIEDLDEIALLTADSPWVLHNFRNGNVLDPTYLDLPPLSDAEFQKLARRYTPGDTSLTVF